MSLFDPIRELENEIAAYREELKRLRHGARKEAIAKVREIAYTFGFSAEELAEMAPGGKTAEQVKREKTPVKYYDPDTGKTWTGAARGKIPEPFNTIIKNHGGDRAAAAADLAKFLI